MRKGTKWAVWIVSASAVLMGAGALGAWRIADWLRERIVRRVASYEQIIRKHAGANDLPVALVEAVIRYESAGDARAVSDKNAKGLMQITPITERELLRRLKIPAGDLFDPEYNIALGQQYLQHLIGLGGVNGNLFRLATAYNGGPGNLNKWDRETPYNGEDRILVPSPKVPSYEEKPEMSAHAINERLINEINKQYYDFILVNYANGDLVGHSANLEAGIKAAAVVDACLGEVVEAGLAKGYVIMVTGDHGNIETMFYPDGSPNPSHGLNPVPFILVSAEPEYRDIKLEEKLGLSSIAPTILKLMEIEKPKDMTSNSLL